MGLDPKWLWLPVSFSAKQEGARVDRCSMRISLLALKVLDSAQEIIFRHSPHLRIYLTKESCIIKSVYFDIREKINLFNPLTLQMRKEK